MRTEQMTQSQGRAAIYSRFSTELQNPKSCKDQAASCREYAARNGLRVVAEYADEGISGASIHNRPDLQRLLADAKAGKFEVIVVEAFDRLSRDNADASTIFKNLEFIGVSVDSVNNGKADAFSFGIHGVMSQHFRVENAKKVKRGMAAVVRDGRSPGGRAYGYRPIPGKPGELAIDEDEAAIVRRIFKEYVGGKSPRDIAGGLNRDKIVPPRGKRWNASTINGNLTRGHGILLNPIYDGRHVWNRVRMVRDPATGKRVSRANPESEWQKADAPHLRIVDQKTFDAAQARKRDETQPGHRRVHGNSRRILSGLLRCGSCGAGMTAHDISAGKRRIICSAVKESGACDNRRRFYLEEIEREVIESLVAEFDRPVVIQNFVDGFNRAQRKEAAAARSEISTLRARREKAVAGKKRLIALAERGLMADVDELAERLKELDRETKALAEQILMADEGAPEPASMNTAEFRRHMSDLEAVFEDLCLGEEIDEATRSLVASLLSHVVVADDQGEVSLTIVIKVRPLMLMNRPLRPDLGGKMVAEERYRLSPHHTNLRYRLRSCA